MLIPYCDRSQLRLILVSSLFPAPDPLRRLSGKLPLRHSADSCYFLLHHIFTRFLLCNQNNVTPAATTTARYMICCLVLPDLRWSRRRCKGQCIFDFMWNTHGGSVRDHIHRFIHNSDRKFKYRIAICIDRVILVHLPLSYSHNENYSIRSGQYAHPSFTTRIAGELMVARPLPPPELHRSVSSIAHVHFHG